MNWRRSIKQVHNNGKTITNTVEAIMLIDKLRAISIRRDNGTNIHRAINNRSDNVSHQCLKRYAITQKCNVDNATT
jgi:hypothetical protein